MTRYEMCVFSTCENDIVTISACESNGGYCVGDSYIRLYDASGSIELSEDDDGCAPCSQMIYKRSTNINNSSGWRHNECQVPKNTK